MAGLTALQREILRRFFATRHEFFLTGGAALVGFYLGHRETHDLDLFTEGAPIDEGERELSAIASALGLEVQPVRRDPAFRRFLLREREGGESLIVDLVRDDAPQLRDKPVLQGVRLDSAEEILANKLCTLLSRVETRDLADVRALEQSGLDPIAAVADATRKDAGVTASQLAWVLATFPLAESDSDLRAYRDDLVRRFAAAAYPPGE